VTAGNKQETYDGANILEQFHKRPHATDKFWFRKKIILTCATRNNKWAWV